MMRNILLAALLGASLMNAIPSGAMEWDTGISVEDYISDKAAGRLTGGPVTVTGMGLCTAPDKCGLYSEIMPMRFIMFSAATAPASMRDMLLHATPSSMVPVTIEFEFELGGNFPVATDIWQAPDPVVSGGR
jgi:hypothetical protein